MSDNVDRYVIAMHKIQTAIRLRLSRESVQYSGHDCCIPFDTNECSPKHLRVGVESALASSEGLARLLVEKSVITEAEVREATTRAVEERAADREQEVRRDYGPNVTLG